MASKFIWYELMTSDLPAAEKFYKAVVGWTTEDFGGAIFPTRSSRRERPASAG